MIKSTGLCLDVRGAVGNTFVDVSKLRHTVTNTNVISAARFGKELAAKTDGASAYLSAGNVYPTINTVMLWIKPVSVAVTEEVLDLNGTAYLKLTNGVLSAEGFSSPTYYVNGILGATTVSTNWCFVAATTATAINANDVEVGRLSGSTFYNGMFYRPRLFSHVVQTASIQNIYEAELAILEGS